MDLSLHLISDLDGTWIPPAGQLASLRALEKHLVGLHGLILTFATGRTLHSAVTDLSEFVHLWPAHFVTDVGTALYHRSHAGKWIEDADYARRISNLWDPESAEQLAQHLPAGIRRQPGFRPRRRMALEVLPGHDLQASAEALAEHLAKAWFPADVLPSNGRCLDVLPKGVDKGTAIEHLEQHLQVLSVLVVCGDSENDLGMLRKADIAVVMSDSPLKEDELGLSAQRVIRPEIAGPAGILQALIRLQSREWPEQNSKRTLLSIQALDSADVGGAR